MESSYTVDSHGVGNCCSGDLLLSHPHFTDGEVEPLSPFLTALCLLASTTQPHLGPAGGPSSVNQHTSDIQGQDTVPITSVLGAWRGGRGIFLKSAGFPEPGWTALNLSRNEHSSKSCEYR